MDFELTDDQREIQALAREFAQAEIEPNAADWDRAHGFPRELIGRLAELGFTGVCIPEEYGGAGADFLSYILVLEELSRADAGVGVTVAVHTSAVTLPILTFGSDEQRARFVPPLARGEAVGAFALTEPEAGSDAGSLRTSATPNGNGWTISGAKQWITNGGFGGTILLFARTDPETPGAKGVSAFILDGSAVTVTREEEKLGLNSSSTVDLVLEDALADRDRLLGDIFAQSFFNEARVDMRSVIRSDYEINVLRHVRFALYSCVENSLVKRVLCKIDDRISYATH